MSNESGSSQMATCSFHIRPARKNSSDAIFIVEVHDAATSFLESVGSASQWGTKKKGNDPAFLPLMERYVTESIETEDTHFHIAEKLNDDNRYIRCGVALIMSILPDAVKNTPEAMIALDGLTNFDYLCILIADQRVQPSSKGVGSFLIQYIKQEAIRKGRKAILVDCWDGNNGILANYYCKQGFHRIAGLSQMGKHIENVMWKGILLRMDL